MRPSPSYQTLPSALGCSGPASLPAAPPPAGADARRSAAWFAVYTLLLLPWMLTYWIGGPQLLGQTTFDKMDVTKLDLAGAGFGA